MPAGVKSVGILGLVSSFVILGACCSPPQLEAPASPAAPEPPAPGVVGSVIGRELDAADKETAVAAQQEAVISGQRKSWRGAHGSYGFIEPAPESALLGGCREYTHKIFVNGRPQQAKGQACKAPDGSWRVTGRGRGHGEARDMVRTAGVEPARGVAPRDFKSLASTDFATSAPIGADVGSKPAF